MTTLRETLDHHGPFASVHMDASHDTEDAAKLTELRWRAIREQLADLDVPDRTVNAIGDAMDRHPPAGRAGRLLVAAEGTVLVDEYLPVPPAQPGVRVSDLPYLLPLADWSHRGVPHVVAVVDQIGADLRAVDAAGTVRTEDVEGHDHPVHKVRGAGWSHRRVQQHAEETVRHNITEVAGEVARLVDQVGAHLLILAGDAPARAQLRDALPKSCQRITAEIEHGRQPDPSHDTVERDVADLLAEQCRDECDVLLDRFRTARGHGLAVVGLADTTAALREGNVETLLIDQSRLGDAASSGERADEALPAAAIKSGADVFTAGDDEDLELADGVGALLRHAQRNIGGANPR